MCDRLRDDNSLDWHQQVEGQLVCIHVDSISLTVPYHVLDLWVNPRVHQLPAARPRSDFVSSTASGESTQIFARLLRILCESDDATGDARAAVPRGRAVSVRAAPKVILIRVDDDRPTDDALGAPQGEEGVVELDIDAAARVGDDVSEVADVAALRRVVTASVRGCRKMWCCVLQVANLPRMHESIVRTVERVEMPPC